MQTDKTEEKLMEKIFMDKNNAEYNVCEGNDNVVKKEYTQGDFRELYDVPVLKGDVFFADLNPVVGYETGGVRPVVIIQNNTGNKFGPTIVAAITSRTNKREMPTHVKVEASTGGLAADSVIMLEQVRTLDKTRLRRFLGHVDEATMDKIEKAVRCSLGINV